MQKRLATLVIGLALVLGTPGAMRSSGAVRATFLTPATAVAVDCTTDATLCLQDGRFLVEATWKKSDGSSGAGHPVNLGSDSGYFWFLDPDNVELVVKALDGCAVNGHGWFFSGGLTNLEVAITVTDTMTGGIKSYANPQGVAFLPIADAAAFGCPAGAAALFARNPEEPRDDDPAILSSSAVTERRAATVGCAEGDTVLCLSGRFQVEATWETVSGASGVGHATNLTPGSGYFWFFDASNVELMVKALDACGLDGGQWFFAAGMTTVGVQLKVTDTFTGELKTYGNTPGGSAPGVAFVPILDTAAFSFCPTPTPTFSPTETATPTTTPRPTQTPRSTFPSTPRYTATPSLTPTPSSTPGPSATPGPPPVYSVTLAAHQEVVACFPNPITQSVWTFSPHSLRVHVGDTINWVWTTGAHSVVSATWDSGVFVGPYTFSKTFTQSGSFPYYCRVGHWRWTRICGSLGCRCYWEDHPDEAGVVTVDP